jgi:hypothetical protein
MATKVKVRQGLHGRTTKKEKGASRSLTTLFTLLTLGSLALTAQWLFMASAQRKLSTPEGAAGTVGSVSTSAKVVAARARLTKAFWIAQGGRAWVTLWGKHLRDDGYHIIRHPKTMKPTDLLVRCCQYPPMVPWARQTRYGRLCEYCGAHFSCICM